MLPNLPARGDMARYLGPRLETVIRLERRDLAILDVQPLAALAAGTGATVDADGR